MDTLGQAATAISNFGSNYVIPAAKHIGTNYVAPAISYAGKHADSWAPPMMNAVSNAVAAKIRSKANKDANKMLEQRD
jgi:hypothetical protein